jgi:aminopeptidase N
VRHYDLDLRYDPAAKRLSGTAVIQAVAVQALSRFDLDLRALTASSVSVDDQPARYRADGDELVITPATPLVAGHDFRVTVVYGGVPRGYDDPVLGRGGFLTNGDGAIAMGEPQVAASWYPVNDHPSDKATYTITMAAPQRLAVVSNGVLTSTRTAAGYTTWTWTEAAPMASYLAMVVVGHYRVHTATHDGRPVVYAVDASLPGTVDAVLARTPEIADYFAAKFGEYPFDAYGGVAVTDPRITYALETVSRPMYAAEVFSSQDRALADIAHELAHQWFGDAVSVRRWADVWLNEGFASYAQWMWQADHGGPSVQRSFDSRYDGGSPYLWAHPPGDPDQTDLFNSSVYARGAMTLHALRITVGDDAFFQILRTWVGQHRGGTATTDDFIALAERVAGRSLHELFAAWLYRTSRPSRPTAR